MIEGCLTKDVDVITSYIVEYDNTNSSNTLHQFEKATDASIQTSIKNIRCSANIIQYLKGKYNNYEVEHVCEMNEIYASRL